MPFKNVAIAGNVRRFIQTLRREKYSGAPHNGRTPRQAADLRTTAVFQERIEFTLEVVHYEPPRSGPPNSEQRTRMTSRALRNHTFLFSISGQQKPTHKMIRKMWTSFCPSIVRVVPDMPRCPECVYTAWMSCH